MILDRPADTKSLCTEITTDQELAELRHVWTELLSRTSYPTPFCTWEWASEWWQHFGKDTYPGFRLLIALAYRPDGLLIGLAPFFFPVVSGPLSLRPLRPLASQSHCCVDDLTEEPVLLLHQDYEEEALRAVCLTLLHWKGKHEWDLVQLRRMRPTSDFELVPFWKSLKSRAPFLFLRAKRRPGQTRTLPDSWPELRRSLSKSMRDNVAYYPRLLTREGHSWRTRIVRTPEEVAAAVSVLIDLHHTRARSERGPRHFNHLPLPVQQHFLRSILPRLAERQMASVALLEVNDVPVAAQTVLECQGRLTFYYSGFDPDWHRYSPVTILQVELIQDAIARGLTRLDFLPEAEPWKTRWGTQEEYVYDEVSCLSFHPRALLRAGWRALRPVRSRFHPLSCDCGYCSEEEIRRPDGDALPDRSRLTKLTKLLLIALVLRNADLDVG